MKVEGSPQATGIWCCIDCVDPYLDDEGRAKVRETLDKEFWDEFNA